MVTCTLLCLGPELNLLIPMPVAAHSGQNHPVINYPARYTRYFVYIFCNYSCEVFQVVQINPFIHKSHLHVGQLVENLQEDKTPQMLV